MNKVRKELIHLRKKNIHRRKFKKTQKQQYTQVNLCVYQAVSVTSRQGVDKMGLNINALSCL